MPISRASSSADEDARRRGKLFGLGFVNYVESSTGSPKERADLIVHPEGVEVVIGTQPAGQGHETSFAQVTADLLGLPFEKVTITLGDTDIVTAGGGTHSGRSMRHASTVIALGAEDLIAKATRLAAHLFEVPVEQIAFDEGIFSAQGTNRTIDWFELAAKAGSSGLPEVRGRLVGAARQRNAPPGVPEWGVHVRRSRSIPTPAVSRSSAMPRVDDVGRCINPLIVHGQTHGGIAQGVGQALWEACVIDPHSGQPLSGSLMDYGMPRFDNMPSFKTEIAEVLSPTNPFGVKAGGEGGTTPAPALIMSAIDDALANVGEPIEIPMPATPVKIWTAIQQMRAKKRSVA